MNKIHPSSEKSFQIQPIINIIFTKQMQKTIKAVQLITFNCNSYKIKNIEIR